MINEETRLRIQVSLWAYAYEFYDVSLVEDHIFDAGCLKINTELSTGNELIDKFFREEFEPSTGMWIRKHPELEKLEQLYRLKTESGPLRGSA